MVLGTSALRPSPTPSVAGNRAANAAPMGLPPSAMAATVAPLSPSSRATVEAVAGRQTSVAQSPQAVRMRALIDAPAKDLGAAVTRHVVEAGRQQIAARTPELSPAVEAIAPEVAALARATATEVLRDPRAMARLGTAVNTLGKAGFCEAVGHAAPELARAFTSATGLAPVNPEAAAAILSRLPAAAEKLAPAHAGQVLAASKGVARKLGLEVAESGAKTVVKGAATTGKAVPALGNAIAIGSALLSAATLVRELAARPPDRERIAKEGVGTLLQTTGIVFPWVALGGDLIDLGWNAKLAAQSRPEACEGQREGLALVGASSGSLAAALEQAGHGDTARCFGELQAATQRAVEEPHARHRRALTSAGARACEALAQLGARELEAVGGAAPSSLSEGFAQLASAIARRRSAPQGGVDRGAARAALTAVNQAVIAEVARSA